MLVFFRSADWGIPNPGTYFLDPQGGPFQSILKTTIVNRSPLPTF
jgi:hypothetical protein